MAACLPEQFMSSGAGPPPAASTARLARSFSGSPGVFCRASSVSPAPVRIRRTPSRWKSSPEWLAAASASSSPSRPSPARTMPAACIGLLDERGKITASGSPTAKATSPLASSATTVP